MRMRLYRRAGFTMVELMVAIVIIAFLATLTALYFPRFQDKEMVNRGADHLQMWLVMAKQQAKRDGLPTGLRLISTNIPGLNGAARAVRTMVFIQQPEDVAQGLFVFANDETTDGSGNKIPSRIWFSLPTGKAFGDSANNSTIPVLPGDYIELNGGGVLHRIQYTPGPKGKPPSPLTQPPSNALDLALGTAQVTGPDAYPPANIPAYANQPVNYRIIRQPLQVSSEQELTLPDNVILDFNANNMNNKQVDAAGKRPMWRGLGKSPYSPSISVFGGDDWYDILFAPSGALIGGSTANGQVVLWVRDGTRDNVNVNPKIGKADLLAGHGTLITIQPRTGFVAAHPAASGDDPYLFTKDSRSSGF